MVYSKKGLLTTVASDDQGKPVYALEGSVFIAGAVVQWLRDQLKVIKNSAESEKAVRKTKDTNGVYFVPAFTGLGAPYWDSNARGLITGLTRGANAAHIIRAGLESIAYQTKDVYDIMLTAYDSADNKKVLQTPVSVNVAPKVVEKIVEKVVKETVAPPPPPELKVKQEKRGLVVSLSSEVLFDSGKFMLKPAAAKSLDEVVKILNDYPENKVVIEGHTDATGNRENNTELSSKRAWGVYSYLVKQGGISAERLSPKGFGPDRPVASNSTFEGKAKNRRVEIIILKKD